MRLQFDIGCPNGRLRLAELGSQPLDQLAMWTASEEAEMPPSAPSSFVLRLRAISRCVWSGSSIARTANDSSYIDSTLGGALGRDQTFVVTSFQPPW